MSLPSEPIDFDYWSDKFEKHVSLLEVADPGHDINHIKRVVKSAKQFAQQEQAKMAVVLPAAWLHDCVQVAKNSPLRAQASQLAAKQAIKLLTAWRYPEIYYAEIAHAIAAHSFSAQIKCETPEAQVVQDADRMDALGAIGIARTFLVGATFGNPLTFHEDPFCYHRTPDDQAAIVDHFYTKLLKLKDSFQTKAAKQEAQKRHDFMQLYLQQLETELI